jgi:hypothetical protein
LLHNSIWQECQLTEKLQGLREFLRGENLCEPHCNYTVGANHE